MRSVLLGTQLGGEELLTESKAWYALITTEEILADYEDPEREDILAALSFAACLMHVNRLTTFGCMKFLVDAQIPRRFTKWLNEAGHDALHALDLPRKDLTPGSEVIANLEIYPSQYL